MKTLGIIAEYNPFHNGHKYQIERAKKISGADNVIIVMSGNYVQRGEPAFIDKYTRAKWAVTNGASLVIELPVCYSTASAETFATAAVITLEKLGIVDFISFGCETDNIEGLKQVAKILSNEPEEYKSLLKKHLSMGCSYPVARKNALTDYINVPELEQILNMPNNILSIEYLKALIRTNSNMEPVPIKRIDAGYHSDTLEYEFASATAIRKALYHKDTLSINKFVPQNVSTAIGNHINNINLNTFSDIFADKLYNNDDFTQFYDVSEFLSNKISKHRNHFSDVNMYIERLHTKEETYSHISRTLLHIILNIQKEDMERFSESGYIHYLHPLAYNENSNLLKAIKNNSKAPIINRFSAFYRDCDNNARKLLDYNLYADNLYNYYFRKNGIILKNDFETKHTDKYLRL